MEPVGTEGRFLELLSEQFPTRQSVFTEIINLEAILGLPRGTEHFMSDVHGEYEAFEHILNNCSGVIRERVRAEFGDGLSQAEQDDLCTLIYYPEEKLAKTESDLGGIDLTWWRVHLLRLLRVAKHFASAYTQSKVRKSMPVPYAYIIDELLRDQAGQSEDRSCYHERIVDTIVDTGSGPDFVESLAALIKRLAVDRLHIVGDLFDRGPHADRICDRLLEMPSTDVQWGNHDIVWMGAAAGSLACQAAVVRNNLCYGALSILESSYGVSMRELALFAERTYRDGDVLSPIDKAISVILFKLEGQLIRRNPDFAMDDRLLLPLVDVEGDCVHLPGGDAPLATVDFPTLNPADPLALTDGEREVIDAMAEAFADSERLRRHVAFLYERGSLYRISNDNLLFHACVPMTEGDGLFRTVELRGRRLAGRDLFDWLDREARQAWMEPDQGNLDLMYYLWCGPASPLSGRVMKTFERTFVTDKATWAEPRDPYWELTESPSVCKQVLREFGVSPEHGHIVNGHTPVKASSGESPVRSCGKLVVIDGGFCTAYHKTTGIAGYTLISDSSGLRIKAHRAFTSIGDVLDLNADIMSDTDRFETSDRPLLVEDSDTGAKIRQRIVELRRLLDAYNSGALKERATRG